VSQQRQVRDQPVLRANATAGWAEARDPGIGPRWDLDPLPRAEHVAAFAGANAHCARDGRTRRQARDMMQIASLTQEEFESLLLSSLDRGPHTPSKPKIAPLAIVSNCFSFEFQKLAFSSTGHIPPAFSELNHKPADLETLHGHFQEAKLGLSDSQDSSFRNFRRKLQSKDGEAPFR
jgi:hypothetical protein